MSASWYIEFLQRLREFRTHCADALNDANAPALVIGGQPFNINFGAASADLKQESKP